MKITLRRLSGNPALLEPQLTKLLSFLGKTEVDDESFNFSSVLDALEPEIALRCLRSVRSSSLQRRKFNLWCVRRIEKLLPEEGQELLSLIDRQAYGDYVAPQELRVATDKASRLYYEAKSGSDRKQEYAASALYHALYKMDCHIVAIYAAAASSDSETDYKMMQDSQLQYLHSLCLEEADDERT